MLTVLILAACGDRGEAGKPATQVAARVNSSEISVHQVNFALRRSADLAPEQVGEAKRQVLDELVDQELAVQEALAAKLDRDPDVMQSVDAARREILAHAYLEQVAAGAAQPTPEEIAAYYRGHPELFAGRKIYHLQEISLPHAPEVMAMVREQLALGRNAGELQAWFKDHRLKVGSRALIKPAEKIDLGMLPKLATMKEGQTALFENGTDVSVITVLAAIPEPLAEAEAKPLIEQYLRRQHGEDREKETMRRLRAKARIEYLGEFSPDADAAKKRKAADAAPGRLAKPASFVAPSEDVIGKGVAGLK